MKSSITHATDTGMIITYARFHPVSFRHGTGYGL